MHPIDMTRPTPFGKRTSARGFTLVELLVVVAIIALLLGILIPALGQARKVAQAAACMAHLRGAGLATTTYTTANRGWLAGPNTSGYAINRAGESYSFSQSNTEPVQNHDWVSPTLGDSLGLPEDRVERIKAIFNTELRCPSNSEFFDDEFSTSHFPSDEVTDIRYSSYSANWWFMLVNRDAPAADADSNLIWMSPSDAALPLNFRSRIDRVGSPSRKAYAFDGAQDVDRNKPDAPLSFNGQKEAFLRGNNYTSNGPVITVYNGSAHFQLSDGSLSEMAKRYAYRHSDKLNITFFDGHVETMGNVESRDVQMYFPSGTRIARASNTADPNDENGDVID